MNEFPFNRAKVKKEKGLVENQATSYFNRSDKLKWRNIFYQYCPVNFEKIPCFAAE